jgi:hypothetical protein
MAVLGVTGNKLKRLVYSIPRLRLDIYYNDEIFLGPSYKSDSALRAGSDTPTKDRLLSQVVVILMRGKTWA